MQQMDSSSGDIEEGSKGLESWVGGGEHEWLLGYNTGGFGQRISREDNDEWEVGVLLSCYSTYEQVQNPYVIEQGIRMDFGIRKKDRKRETQSRPSTNGQVSTQSLVLLSRAPLGSDHDQTYGVS
mmetsp:Transcript_13273/g.26961  ORF Transcript_13273/g.26961 Transcript_13273/m.26961 type:complete len:125 (-) Transcript_13273:1260-1634(-)